MLPWLANWNFVKMHLNFSFVSFSVCNVCTKHNPNDINFNLGWLFVLWFTHWLRWLSSQCGSHRCVPIIISIRENISLTEPQAQFSLQKVTHKIYVCLPRRVGFRLNRMKCAHESEQFERVSTYTLNQFRTVCMAWGCQMNRSVEKSEKNWKWELNERRVNQKNLHSSQLFSLEKKNNSVLTLNFFIFCMKIFFLLVWV